MKGDPAALLFVEFADSPEENADKIRNLHDTMSDLGYGFGKGGAKEGGLVEVWDAGLIGEIGELRKSGLNIMMSMKDARKPVSFVEDAAVVLDEVAVLARPAQAHRREEIDSVRETLEPHRSLFLEGLPAPDAVFIGGGLSPGVFKEAWSRLRPLGRLVANGVTLESEAVLLDLHKRHGGQLVRLIVNRAEPVGTLTGWRPLMPVTQWSLVK